MVVDRARTSTEPRIDGPAAPRYYSISQTAALLGVSRVTIWRWLRDGRLTAHRLGHRTIRINHDDLERALTSARPGGSQSWGVRQARQAAAPAESEHIVQFYESDAFLLQAVRDHVGKALRAGDGAIVIATGDHGAGIDEHLATAGIDVDDARARGQYVALDAADTLAQFMVDGQPDAARFDAVVGTLMRRMSATYGNVRAFGEMVAILALAGNHAGATRLEALWNDLATQQTFSLLCAYPMDRLDGEAAGQMIGEVCGQHASVIAAESYAGLTSPDDQQRAIARLQQKAASLEAEIAERQRVEQALRDAIRVRDEFLSIASHELRTPLTTVRALSQLMLRRLDKHGEIDPPAGERAFRQISDQAGKLTRLVEQLLDVSRLEAGKLSLATERTDLRDLIERVVAEAGVRTSQRIDVRAPEAVEAEVDPLRIDQMLTNLLDNAIRYSDEDQPIEVELARLPGGQVEIAIRDRGPGIPEASREGIFDRYYQGDKTSRQRGIGLGLYLCRQIAELHGGQIDADYPEDGGTRFVIRLPGEVAPSESRGGLHIVPS
jgi:excisionase family DNA binding protein